MSIQSKLDYDSFSAVLEEVRDILVIDLKQLNLQIADRYKSCLKASSTTAEQIYFKNSATPYVSISEAQPLIGVDRSGKYKLTSFRAFIQFKGIIKNRFGEVISNHPPYIRKKIFTSEASIDRAAILNAAVVAYQYLDLLCPQTRPTCSSSLRKGPRLYIKPEHLLVNQEGLIEFVEEDNPGIDQLFIILDEFTKRDRMCLYHITLNDTILKIHKGLDYRIVEYYRYKFEEIIAHAADDPTELEYALGRESAFLFQ